MKTTARWWSASSPVLAEWSTGLLGSCKEEGSGVGFTCARMAIGHRRCLGMGLAGVASPATEIVEMSLPPMWELEGKNGDEEEGRVEWILGHRRTPMVVAGGLFIIVLCCRRLKSSGMAVPRLTVINGGRRGSA